LAAAFAASHLYSLFVTSVFAHPYLHSFLHDALPISHLCTAYLRHYKAARSAVQHGSLRPDPRTQTAVLRNVRRLTVRYSFLFRRDRKSTRLNSSHVSISYAVFCLKKKKSRY